MRCNSSPSGGRRHCFSLLFLKFSRRSSVNIATACETYTHTHNHTHIHTHTNTTTHTHTTHNHKQKKQPQTHTHNTWIHADLRCLALSIPEGYQGYQIPLSTK